MDATTRKTLPLMDTHILSGIARTFPQSPLVMGAQTPRGFVHSVLSTLSFSGFTSISAGEDLQPLKTNVLADALSRLSSRQGIFLRAFLCDRLGIP